jgi:hypothetical protein
MTEEEYYAQVSKLGLRPSKIPTVYQTADGDPYNVPMPGRYTPEQRAEFIERLKTIMGVGWRDD